MKEGGGGGLIWYCCFVRLSSREVMKSGQGHLDLLLAVPLQWTEIDRALNSRTRETDTCNSFVSSVSRTWNLLKQTMRECSDMARKYQIMLHDWRCVYYSTHPPSHLLFLRPLFALHPCSLMSPPLCSPLPFIFRLTRKGWAINIRAILSNYS